MQNKLFIILGFVFASPFFCFSQKKLETNFQSIPSEVIHDRHFVSVEKRHEVEILNQTTLIDKKSEIYLILNDSGLKSIDLSVYYDKLSKVKSIECKIYDRNGNLVKNFKEKDFKDTSIADGFSIFSDDRVKFLNLNYYNYPFFVKFDVETERNNTLVIPSFIPINEIDEFVLNTNYSLSYPIDFEIKKIENNLEKFDVKKIDTNGKISYSAINLKAPIYEDLNSRYIDLLPLIKFSNNTIGLSEVKGKINSWEDFGKWYYNNFLSDTEELSEETIFKIKELTKNADSDIEKARLIFDYVQNNTRYISIQVGLGGWKPFSAKDVDKLGYGDCKALTNYTRVLLKKIGIESFYTIIHADENIIDINENLISLQGNHVILTVPSSEGNVFLECTSQKIPFGFLGTSTINRQALAIKSDGAFLIKTKSKDDNILEANFIVDLNDMKRVRTKVDFTNKGSYYNNIYSINANDKKEVTKYLKSVFNELKELSIINYETEDVKDDYQFKEHIQLESDFIGSKMGNDYLLNINPFLETPRIPKKYDKRLTSFSIDRSKVYEISTVYLIPEGYQVLNLPSSNEINSKFGSLNIQIAQEDKKIVITEKIILKDGEFSNEDYESYRQFLTQIALNNNSKFVVSKL